VVSKKSAPLFEQLLNLLVSTPEYPELLTQVLPLGKYCADSLKAALDEFASINKTMPLTKWKNEWLEKDNDGNFIFAGRHQNQRLTAAAEVYRRYQDELANRRLYDYDDMILRAIDALER